ncbi:MAG: 4Fe-4S binding protein [Deltaproteobacteria bacterium]|nr:4Fe-4S binding protein [Deltaproteobacteria bacterium]
MSTEIYQEFCDIMKKRGGMYPGADIPEFYPLVKELFTPEEAAVSIALDLGFSPASDVATKMGKGAKEVEDMLEAMAYKGLCISADLGGTIYYGGPPFVPGIFEFQFMRGTKTEKDKKLAKLIHAYKAAYRVAYPPKPPSFPQARVITIDKAVKADNMVYPYNQVAHYIETNDPLAVCTCFCRHEAKLIDEKDDCKVPDESCMMFGTAAQFVIDRKIGRKITKEEALKILKDTEDAGLVHAGINKQKLDFLCNCCRCHCMILKTALAYPKPGEELASGFQPVWDAEFCSGCETCVDRCPMTALTSGEENVPVLNLDRCIGCGVCLTGCPMEAISLEMRPGTIVPPVDDAASREAMRAGRV